MTKKYSKYTEANEEIYEIENKDFPGWGMKIPYAESCGKKTKHFKGSSCPALDLTH